jgi:hypothetical protein
LNTAPSPAGALIAGGNQSLPSVGGGAAMRISGRGILAADADTN